MSTAKNVAQTDLLIGSSNEVSASFEVIGPELATEYLKLNTANRRLESKVSLRLARDMSDGFWQVTGDSIKFAVDGELIDGQHRLWAVIKSGTRQKFLVVRNVSKESKIVTDTGKPRTFAHILDFQKQPNSTALASVSRLAYSFHYDMCITGQTISHSKLLEFIEEFPVLHDIASWVKSVDKGLQIFAPPSIWGLTKFATIQSDRELSDEFFDLIKLPPQILNHPATVLHRSLVSTTRSKKRGSASRIYLMAVIIKAWNAMYENRPIKLLKYQVGEPFPVLSGYKYAESQDEVIAVESPLSPLL